MPFLITINNFFCLKKSLIILTIFAIGTVPSWLNGVLYRTGPGIQYYGEERYQHAFDPTAILHAFEISDDAEGKKKIEYRSRVLDCDTYRKNKAAGRITMTELGTVASPDPCKSMMGRFFARFFTIEDMEVSSNELPDKEFIFSFFES